MNKKTFLFVLMAILSTLGVKADVIPSTYYSSAAEGTYYLYNVNKGQFLERKSNNFPGLTDTPAEVTLAATDGGFTVQFADGKFLHTGYWNNQYLWTDGVAGSANEQGWAFTVISGKVYQILRTAEETVNGITGTFYANGTNAATEATDDCQWALILPTDYTAYQKAKATENAIPVKYRSAIPTEAGEYYIYDVMKQKFLDTSARTLSDSPTALTTVTPSGSAFLISGASGKYLKIGVWKGQYLWSDGDDSNTKWTIEAADGEEAEKIFYIYTNDFTETNAEVAGKTMYLTGTNASSTKPADSQWALITKADYDAYTAVAFDPAKVTGNKTAIVSAKGDATALLQNPSFAESAAGWTGGNRTSCQLYRGAGYDYESTAENATFAQTISNMPKGTYKVVAAVRGGKAKTTTATAKVAGEAGETVTNDDFAAANQFNTNGVLMPKSTLGGFNYAKYALGWQWVTATGTLAEDGALTIEFEMTGADWKGIADVHLYYMSDGTNTYAVEYTDGVDAANHAVTCDLVAEDANRIFTSTAAITTAAGETVNNNLVSGNIANLVLYESADFTAPEGNNTATKATVYRTMAAEKWNTLVLPFDMTIPSEWTVKEINTFNEGALSFKTAESIAAGKPCLVMPTTAVSNIKADNVTLVKALTNATTDTGKDYVSMVGTYAQIAAVEEGCYVIGVADDKSVLSRVKGTVSLKPFRAYFTVSGEAPAHIDLSFDNEDATAIQSVETETMKNTAIYNLAGQRVNKPMKGLYIVNGKKVLF